MSSTSDSRVDTSDRDRDPYDAEPARNDPWASGPGHLSQDGQETERFVPEQGDGEHDGHLYASDTYAEPETEVVSEGKGASSEAPAEARPEGFHDSDEPTAVGVAHVDGADKVDSSEEPTAVVSHSDDTTTDDDAEARADEATDVNADVATDVTADEAEEAEVAEEEAREDAEVDRAEDAEEEEADGHDEEEARADDEPESRPEPIVETVPLPAAEPVAVVTPVAVEPVHAEPVAAGSDDLVAVPVAVADEPADEPTGPAGELTGELKPGDVPVTPVAGFFATDAVAGLRDRWREAQLGFVDDPRKAVDDVKTLVSEAVDQFTAALSAQRDELDAAAGEDTEQYRVAVQRYRTFFDRLLGL